MEGGQWRVAREVGFTAGLKPANDCRPGHRPDTNSQKSVLQYSYYVKHLNRGLLRTLAYERIVLFHSHIHASPAPCKA
jgi:hypothetical protein